MSIGAVGCGANYYNTNDNQNRKTESGGTFDFSSAVQNFKETNQLTAEELKEDKDWRDMSSDEWDKTLEGVDEYIDAAKEQIRYLKKKQDEAAAKAAVQADADRKVTAASSAACKAATGTFVGTAEENADDSADYEKNWTKNLKTDDQTVLRTAKAAQDMEKRAMSKLQEIQLMDHAAKGISQSENVTEYVSVEEDENEEKIWTVTSFGEDGIISTRCQNGKVLDSWNIKYDNPEDAKKVWDYFAKFKNDDELEFAGSKDFWMEFLSDDMARDL